MEPTRAASPSKPPRPLPMVCSRAVAGDARYFPQAEYEGRKYFFCTDYCLNAFLESPERFLAAHRKKRGTCADPAGNLTGRKS
jgi:YHS domain-containing protein